MLSGLNRLYEYWRTEDLESVLDLVSLGVDQSVLLLTSYAAMGKEQSLETFYVKLFFFFQFLRQGLTTNLELYVDQDGLRLSKLHLPLFP